MLNHYQQVGHCNGCYAPIEEDYKGNFCKCCMWNDRTSRWDTDLVDSEELYRRDAVARALEVLIESRFSVVPNGTMACVRASFWLEYYTFSAREDVGRVEAITHALLDFRDHFRGWLIDFEGFWDNYTYDMENVELKD